MLNYTAVRASKSWLIIPSRICNLQRFLILYLKTNIIAFVSFDFVEKFIIKYVHWILRIKPQSSASSLFLWLLNHNLMYDVRMYSWFICVLHFISPAPQIHDCRYKIEKKFKYLRDHRIIIIIIIIITVFIKLKITALGWAPVTWLSYLY